MATTQQCILGTPLKDSDPEVNKIIQDEYKRQSESLELIASENVTSLSVLQCNGSCLTNKYSEGYPGKRYYGGNEVIDELETLCQRRALDLFDLNSDEWGVNVQSYSGSTANFSVYTALLQPNDRIMGLDLPSGGHLTHGYYTSDRKVSNSAIYFQSLNYTVNSETNLLNYDELDFLSKRFIPKLIICGASAYPRDWDYERIKSIASNCGSYLMADIAHTSGFVSSRLLKSPFEYCDVVTTTTHKTLRGPRAALIFYRKGLEQNINFAVFPSSQGGPHNQTIAAIATALRQANTDEYKEYIYQVSQNAKTLAKELMDRGLNIVTGGTDNHIVLWNVKATGGITGSKFEKVCDMCNVSLNKNTISGDRSALSPSGVRLGTAAMTSRGMKSQDMILLCSILVKIYALCIDIQSKCTSKAIKEFCSVATTNFGQEIESIREEVRLLCKHFPLPYGMFP